MLKKSKKQKKKEEQKDGSDDDVEVDDDQKEPALAQSGAVPTNSNVEAPQDVDSSTNAPHVDDTQRDHSHQVNDPRLDAEPPGNSQAVDTHESNSQANDIEAPVNDATAPVLDSSTRKKYPTRKSERVTANGI